MIDWNFKQVDPKHSEQIGRAVYCHHCKRLEEQVLLGRDDDGNTVFLCTSFGCGKTITVNVELPHK